MADSILKLRVESSEYDAKLKKAAEGIRHLAEVAHKGGGKLTGLEKAELDYVKGLGSMETKSRTAAGSVRELESVFKELTVVYNHLNDVEKQDEGGKALRESLEQIKQRAQEARTELEAASKSLQGVENSMKGANDGSFLSKLGGKMDGALAVFGGNLMTKAAGMGIGLVTEMTDAVKQGIELAKAGEGIRIAFERLGRGDILDGLREATHGTVTDLELMKAAVKFNDFKLPVEELGTMLAFAQQKAKDTGQSVDYMVDSIVTGLGRKSLMILDNLGLSATEIRERMKETGDMTKAVGAIIREQMAAAGEYVETAADRAAQANVSLQNKMEELGRKFGPVEEASNQLWTSIKIGILDIIGGPLATLLNQLTEAGRLKNAITNMNGGGNGSPTRVDRMISMLGDGQGARARNTYNQQIKAFDDKIEQQKFRIASLNDNDAITRGLKQKAKTKLKALQALKAEYISRAKDIMQPVNFNVNTKQAEQNVVSLRKQLKELEEQRKKAVKSGDQEQVENLTKQISQVKTNIGYLDPKANKTGSSSKTAQTELQENQAKINALTQEYVKLGDESTEAARERQAEIQKEIELLKERNGLLGLRAEQAQGRMTLGAGDFQRDGLSNTPGTLLKAPDTTIPRGGLQLSDKQMKAVNKSISGVSSMADGIDKSFTSAASAVSALGSAFASIEDPAAKVIGTVSQAIATIALGYATATTQAATMGPWAWIAFAATGLATMISTISAIHSSTGYANGGMIDSGHSPSFLSFSKAAPAFATGGVVPQTITSMPKFATGGIIQNFNDGGTVEAGHAPDFLSFSKAMPKFATGGTIPHANGGYFVGGTHYSSDVTPIMANAGELVLNKAQQGNLASQLQGGGMQNLNLTATIKGEQIRLALNNNGRRTGRGEYVQSRNVR